MARAKAFWLHMKNENHALVGHFIALETGLEKSVTCVKLKKPQDMWHSIFTLIGGSHAGKSRWR